MLASNEDHASGGPVVTNGKALTDWARRHIRPGEIVCFGAPFVPGLDPTTYRLVELRDFAAADGATYDHAWVNNALAPGNQANQVARRLYDMVRPGGTLLLAVPFGLTPGTISERVFYPNALRRLVSPLFDIVDMLIVDDHIVLVGRRRDEPVGTPTSHLDPDELAFFAHEKCFNAYIGDLNAEIERLNNKIADLSRQLVASGARYRSLEARSQRLQAELQRTSRELRDLRRKIDKIRPYVRIPLAVYRRLRRLKAALARRLGRVRPATVATTTPAGTSAAAPVAAAPAARAGGRPAAVPAWRKELRAEFEKWLTVAREAPGDEVVVMFSGTTFVQEHRANRPIRLTNVYLRRGCPVFFNYYRANDREPLPKHPDPRLFQSPIDATQSFLDDLLTADFGGKKKMFFVSFPHEMMVRYMMLAAQLGWVTIYDARDDWEEFAKVGMAKWYVPGYERYVAKFADVVTAVSRPLARKMEVISGREVHVSANALDPQFPRPSGPRQPSHPPVIGYFGHLTDKWFDWPLLIAAAERYPTYRFELAGHQYPKDLTLPRNVELLGLVGHAELAERSRRWSVALIPFKNGPLADAVDPIKVYEYLHLRVPVLATWFPQCRDYPGTTITEGREEFIEQLGQLVGREVPEAEVAAWLARNTWEHRVDQYSALADEVRRRGRDPLTALVGGAL